MFALCASQLLLLLLAQILIVKHRLKQAGVFCCDPPIEVSAGSKIVEIRCIQQNLEIRGHSGLVGDHNPLLQFRLVSAKCGFCSCQFSFDAPNGSSRLFETLLSYSQLSLCLCEVALCHHQFISCIQLFTFSIAEATSYRGLTALKASQLTCQR